MILQREEKTDYLCIMYENRRNPQQKQTYNNDTTFVYFEKR
jgi:hypothetical protein